MQPVLQSNLIQTNHGKRWLTNAEAVRLDVRDRKTLLRCRDRRSEREGMQQQQWLCSRSSRALAQVLQSTRVQYRGPPKRFSNP